MYSLMQCWGGGGCDADDFFFFVVENVIGMFVIRSGECKRDFYGFFLVGWREDYKGVVDEGGWIGLGWAGKGREGYEVFFGGNLEVEMPLSRIVEF